MHQRRPQRSSSNNSKRKQLNALARIAAAGAMVAIMSEASINKNSGEQP
jgi:hypothetical protein